MKLCFACRRDLIEFDCFVFARLRQELEISQEIIAEQKIRINELETTAARQSKRDNLAKSINTTTCNISDESTTVQDLRRQIKLLVVRFIWGSTFSFCLIPLCV